MNQIVVNEPNRWRLESPVLETLSNAVRRAAASALREDDS